MVLLNFLGLLGAIIVAAAYVPQIVRLLRRRCACSLSVKAWGLWLLAALLILPNALFSGNIVFITLQAINFTAVAFITIFVYLHQRQSCPVHV